MAENAGVVGFPAVSELVLRVWFGHAERHLRVIIRGAMTLSAALEQMRTLCRLLEDLWIEREALCWHLRQRGYTVEELKQICTDAKLDPQLREQARAAYAQMRESLEQAAMEVALEDISQQPPPTGESN